MPNKKTRVFVLDGDGAKDLADGIQTFETPDGDIIAAATDKGIDYKDVNEDRVVVNPKKRFVGVVDGMGGYQFGWKAAQILAKHLGKLPEDIETAVRNAQAEMRDRVIGSGGAAFISFRIIHKKAREVKVEIAQAGDSRIIIADNDGSITFESDDESLVAQLVRQGFITFDEALYHPRRQTLLNAVGEACGIVKVNSLVFSAGQRAILITDGISDNLTAEELVSLVLGKSPTEAIEVISEVTNNRMQGEESIIMNTANRTEQGEYSDGFKSRPKPDNRGMAIIDF